MNTEDWDYSDKPNELSLFSLSVSLAEAAKTKGIQLDETSMNAALRQAILLSYFHPEYWSAIAIDLVNNSKEEGWDLDKLRDGALKTIEDVEYAKNEANRVMANLKAEGKWRN